MQKWSANNERNWYAWEFKQTIFQKLHRCISETQASFQYPLQNTYVHNPSGFKQNGFANDLRQGRNFVK